MSILPTRPLPLVVLATSLMLALPAPALAGGSLPPGVHLDPGSPAAKEYALPLATARGAPSDMGSTGALFGNGIRKNSSSPAPAPATSQAEAAEPIRAAGSITSSTTSSPSRSRTQAAASPHHRHHRRTVSRPRHRPSPAGTSSPAPSQTVVPAATRILHPGTGQGWLLMLVFGGAVLGLGGAGAFLIQRRQRSPRSKLS